MSIKALRLTLYELSVEFGARSTVAEVIEIRKQEAR